MRKPSIRVRLSLFAVTSWTVALAAKPSIARADNPIVQTNYTADPAPMVHEGRLYLYTSHDEDVTVNGFFTMNDWRVYSTTDVVNWTDHGSPLSYKTFRWARGDAWAGQCVARNGKFYWYVPLTQTTGGQAIGVAVSDSPIGPFADPLGKRLVSTGTGDIDPTVFIDDDGQAYLYWGNPRLWYVKLNADMISYAGSPVEIGLTTAGFGARSKTDRATAYEEGPWFYKRGSLYHLAYAANGIPEQLSQATSSSPTGPWTFRGVVMDPVSSFTNHPGVVDFAGNSYLFYHTADLPGGGGFKRSVAVEQFTYRADGTIPPIKPSKAGPAGVGHLDPYVRTEAETIAWAVGVETEVCSEGGMNVTSIHDGDSIKVKGVDFRTGAVAFDARVAASTGGGAIELRLDGLSGPLVGTCTIQATGGLQRWATRSCAVAGASGIHDLFLKFTGGSGELFKFDWWKFTPRDAVPDAGPPDAGETDSGSSGSSGSSGTPSAQPDDGGRSDGGMVGRSGGTVSASGVAGSAGRSGVQFAGASGSMTGSAGASSGAKTGSAGSSKGAAGSADGVGDEAGLEGRDGGCACKVVPNRDGAPWSVLLLLLVRRRRRGPSTRRDSFAGRMALADSGRASSSVLRASFSDRPMGHVATTTKRSIR